jgi:hypothetical protein
MDFDAQILVSGVDLRKICLEAGEHLVKIFHKLSSHVKR